MDPTVAARRSHSLGMDKTLATKTAASAAAAAEIVVDVVAAAYAAAAAVEEVAMVAMEVEVEAVANYRVSPNPLKLAKVVAAEEDCQ